MHRQANQERADKVAEQIRADMSAKPELATDNTDDKLVNGLLNNLTAKLQEKNLNVSDASQS